MSQSTDTTTTQTPPPVAESQPQHRWLRKLLGEWTYEFQEPAGPKEPAVKATGTESVRAIGDLWVLAEGRGEMPGAGLHTTIQTLGYAPDKGRFVGTWIGSMMTDLWIYDGELDPAERVLTLNSEGPSMKGDGTRAQYQDVIEFKNDDHRVLTARTQKEDGTWQQFMTVHYRRKK